MPTDSVYFLGADYEEIVPMAQGGTGELFRAHKRGLDVEVVIKRCKTRYHGRMDETREARILKNLRHQYLPRIYDVIYGADGYAYTVMDYIQGCNLEEYVRRHGALSQKQTVHWLRQLCEVISYLHRQHPAVIHCDLKPQNVMITPEGDVCVIDFNTSLLYENRELQAIGATSGYAAPEQYHVSEAALNGLPPAEREKRLLWSRMAAPYGKVTERTDIYAIGALGYFMMTGYNPAHCLENVIPLTRYRIQLGDSLRAVIEKAMQPDPKRRFSSVKVMLNALENLKKTDQRYRNWQRSCQITATVLSVLMLLSVFSVWLGFQLRGREQNGQYAELIAQADALIDSQQYEESLPLLTEAVSLEDDRIEAYVRLATILYRLGRYDACIDTLSGLNFTADDSAMNQQEFEYAQAELNYVLGSCYYQKEDYENAVRCMELAVWFAPEESAYYRDLSVAQALSGDLKAARKTYEAMEALDHAEKDDLLLVESELDFAEGRYEAALTPLQQLLRSENQDLVNRSCLLAAQCCQRLGTDWLNQEISLLEEGCSLLDVSRADAVREQLADAYLRRGVETGSAADYEKALRELDNLLNRQVASLPVLLDKGLALQYLGRNQEAVSVLEEAVSRYPNDYRGYLRLALLYLTPAAYDADRAVDFYQQAAALYKGANAQNSEFQYLESLIQSLTG